MPSRMRAVLVANFCVSLMAATSEETAPRAPQPSSTPPDPFNVSIPPGFCPCNETKVEDDKLRGQKALETHEAIKNKSSWIARIHHRATHSHEAFSASLNVGFLVCLIVIGVLTTKMWRDKAHRAIQQKQPVQFDSHSTHSEILVKDMLKKRARTFVNLFHKLKEKAPSSPSSNPQQELLQMETFVQTGAQGEERQEEEEEEGGARRRDQVDASSRFHQRLLLSSSSSDLSFLDSSDEEEEEEKDGGPVDASSVYSLIPGTGVWSGSSRAKTMRSREGGSRGRGGGGLASSIVAFFRTKDQRVTINTVDIGDDRSSNIRLLAETSSDEEENEPFRIG